MPVRGRRSLRGQLVRLTALASTLAVVLLGALVQWLLSTTTDASIDRTLARNASAIADATVQASSASRITVPATRLDAGVAVYDGSGNLVAGAVPASLRDAYDGLARERASSSRPAGDVARVHAQGFRTGAGTRGTVVVSERTAPFEQADRFALWVSVGAGLLLVGASTGLVAYASRRVLAPVEAMAHTADDWSEHDLSRRFDLGTPDNEITALGHTLDGLLEKVATTIRSEQRLTSELAHELRTPLTAIQGTAELLRGNPSLDAEARADLDDITQACRRMSSTITSLLEVARSASSLARPASCRVADVVAEVVKEVGRHDERGLVVETDVAPGAAWAVAHPLAVRALTPIVSNAARFARSTVRVSARELPGGAVGVLVDDDGPGVTPALRTHVFEPGQTGGGGAGLGLALARRIARASGGDVDLVEDPRASTTFRLTLPAAHPSTHPAPGRD